jgi:phosphonate transport system ATP-binding protein
LGQRLVLDGVGVRFGDAAALEGVTLSVAPGEKLAVIGASGAGKSTLFRTLTRSVALGSGSVTVGGRNLYALSGRELGAMRRGVGTIHQAYNLVPELSAGMNAALGEVGGLGRVATLRTLLLGPDAGLSRRVEGALQQVGLGERLRARTADLSGGQQQRVAVARLLVQRPGLILADEPFAAVDPVTAEKVMAALLDLNHEGATLLVNLHDVAAARTFPRIVALRKGRIAFDGEPKDLTDEMLAGIYEGDERRVQHQEEKLVSRRREPMRVAEGRDGVSAH